MGEIKKPLIRQAGSAEAFLNSATTGREHIYYHLFSSFCKGYEKIKCFILMRGENEHF